GPRLVRRPIAGRYDGRLTEASRRLGRVGGELLDSVPQLTGLADRVDRRFSAPGAGVQGRRRIGLLEERPHLIVAADDRVARSGAVLLEAVQHLPESTALRAVRVGTRGIVELDPLQDRVEVDLLLRNHAERLNAGDESRLAALVRPEPGELLDVPAGHVHEDRLGRVVEVQAGRHVVRTDLAGRAVQRLAPEGAAVAAWDRSGIAGHDLVHRMPRRLFVGEDPMLDAQPPAEPLRELDARGPIGGDALVDRDPDELDISPRPEEVREQRGGRARVLASAHADGNALAPSQVDLRAQLAFRASLDEVDEATAARIRNQAPTRALATDEAIIDAMVFLKIPTGKIRARVMSKTRIPATKNAPNKVHQRRFVSLQLRLRPPIAFVSSIMIAGAYRLIAIVTYRATMPPMTKPISDPQIATMAAELEGPPNEIEGIRTSNGSKTRPK